MSFCHLTIVLSHCHHGVLGRAYVLSRSTEGGVLFDSVSCHSPVLGGLSCRSQCCVASPQPFSPQCVPPCHGLGHSCYSSGKSPSHTFSWLHTPPPPPPTARGCLCFQPPTPGPKSCCPHVGPEYSRVHPRFPSCHGATKAHSTIDRGASPRWKSGFKRTAVRPREAHLFTPLPGCVQVHGNPLPRAWP